MKKTAILFLAFLLPTKETVHAQVSAQVKQMAYADSGRLVEIFKDLHQNPELGFMEVRTSAIIAKELKALGYEVTTGIGKTGVVGILKNCAGSVVMYRADMLIMGSEDFNHQVLGINKTVCDYIWVGPAQPDLYARAFSEGKKAPFYNHNGKLPG